MIDKNAIRAEFPILDKPVKGKKLVYLDNAATSQRPRVVVQAEEDFYFNDNAATHRSVHTLGERATKAYEDVREKVRAFINAKHATEIIFTRGTTEAINLVASSYGNKYCEKGDEIVISEMEHHSNIVPWQLLCEKTGAVLRVTKITDAGEIILDDYVKLLNARTKLVAITHVSNVLGTINPIKEMIALAHARGIPVLVDGAQAVAHMSVDVQDLDCDFYAFSGHKMYGPTGIGVLYGKADLLQNMPPYQGGGSMIKTVTFAKTEYADPPQRFEAGTQNVAGVIGLGAAVDFLSRIGMNNIAAHEDKLLKYATQRLREISDVKIIGNAVHKTGVISMVFPDIHPHDVATILDSEGIAIRAGHHCAMPLMSRFNIPATARASFGVYNTEEEVDALIKGLKKVKEVFK